MDTSVPNKSSKQNNMVTKMVSLNRYRESLHQLQSIWDNLSLLGQLSGTGTDMNETRLAFSQVTNNVLDSLAEETLNKTVTAITVKAQVAVDIVVRNLFERTADIGFLATDDNVSGFLIKHAEDMADDDDYEALKDRFKEYVKKYSVYFNIVLLDLEGNVLVQLDENNPISVIHDPLVQESIHTEAAYIEVFRKTDLLPNQDVGLVYAFRVTRDNSNEALGVLCLCFRFKNEMEGVFAELITQQEWAVGLLLDQDGRVIASSDSYQIPIGAKLEKAGDADWIITRFAGREYLAVTKHTKGYQGYMGPGWIGHAMIPLEHAFDDDISSIINNIDNKLLKKVMRSPLLFSQTLLEIPKQAATIQSKLNQSVWNGNIWQKRNSNGLAHQTNFSKMLLWEISNTGFKTQHVIEKTVSDLYQTVVSVMLENSRFFASLAVDIMDRNLYERANDCRWWALTATFQQLLSKPKITDHDKANITRVLVYINNLYTVYSNLVVFDKQGEILAVSNSSYQHFVGTTIDAEWVNRTRSLRSSQDYVVSKFEPSPLYKNQPTYIYSAAIRAENNQVVGGIGIVFDSTPQFSAMLEDSLPRDSNGEPIIGSFTLYVDGDLQVISSTMPAFKVGSQFTLQAHLCKLAPGEAAFDIAIYEGRYYAVGARASSGYREFKGPEDAYQNPITALIFIPLGIAAEIDAIIEAEYAFQHNQFKPTTTNASAENAEEFATFYVGNQWLGLPATQVIEAIQTNQIKSLPDTSSILEGIMQHQGKVIPVVNLARAIGAPEDNTPTDSKQVVVIQRTAESSHFGILVNALGEIPAIVLESIEPMATIFANANTTTEGITKVESDNGQHNLLVVISAESLWNKIIEAHKLLEAGEQLPDIPLPALES